MTGVVCWLKLLNLVILKFFLLHQTVKVLSQRRLADTASNLSVFIVYLAVSQYISGILVFLVPEASIGALIHSEQCFIKDTSRLTLFKRHPKS